jgi:aspartate aminotransferase-like enzyme
MNGCSLQFKVATEDWEFEQIHHLNYRTFVEEIPQHEPSTKPRLVDRFHHENTYLICLCGDQVVGMIAMRGQRPFSLDQKLPDLDSYLPSGRRPCEIRLLSVERDFRNGQVFRGLTALVWQYGTDRGFNLAVISGTTRQQKLYRHLGFVPFGPLVGTGEAQFQPMYLTLETFEKNAEEFFRTPLRSAGPVSFLPGPVTIHRRVRRAFERPAESHRSDRFVAEFQKTRQRLCQLVGARHVEILLGSGTLGNDAVAAQLTLEKTPGLVVSNGEFGERLIDQAQRFGLNFESLKFGWGERFDLAAIGRFIERGELGWVWCAHTETSTGMLNPLPALQDLCTEAKVKLCADCISSIGVTPVNLDRIYLATCASGKGLAAYPGLSMVFYNHAITPSKRLPRYLDLGWYAEHQGIAFTHSSNLIHALDAALQREDWPRKFADLDEVSRGLRAKLRGAGFTLITPDAESAPGVATIDVSPALDSAEIGRQITQAGFLVSYNSDYLRRRNWIQICLMGEFAVEKLDSLIAHLQEACGLKERHHAETNGLVKKNGFAQKATARVKAP